MATPISPIDTHRTAVLEDARKKWLHETHGIREMLNSPPGLLLMEEMRKDSLEPPEGIYVMGSFDRTAFNLGVLSVYAKLKRVQEGKY